MGTSGGTVTWSLGGSGWQDASGIGFFSGASVALGGFLNFDFVAQLERAFAAWEAVANIKFVRVADGGGDAGVGDASDIRIFGGFIDGPSNVLAQAYFPVAGGTNAQGAAQGDMVFDSGESAFWDADSFFVVAMHELGHSLGLAHEYFNTAVMNPYFNPDLTGLLPDDIDGIRAIYGSANNGRTVYNMPAGQKVADFSNSGFSVAVNGNALGNTVVGSQNDDVLNGRAGGDILFGLAGNDILRGGPGDDRMFAGAGDDRMFGGIQDDQMYGNDGDDYMIGGDGDDHLAGQVGDDFINGGRGRDTAYWGVAKSDTLLLEFGDWIGVVTENFGLDLVTNVEFFGFRDGTVFADGAYFDAYSYIATYGGLMDAFGTDGVAGFRHFIKHGLEEGRSIGFDAGQYLENYDGLRETFGADGELAARHFISTGRFEGRTDLNGLEYIASYAGLMDTFGADKDAGFEHYLQYGRAEGRSQQFDGLLYLASHGRLIEAFGTVADLDDTGARHFINNGFDEGRGISFDPAAYLEKYDGLRAVFGADFEAATEHYIRHGYDEGRFI